MKHLIIALFVFSFLSVSAQKPNEESLKESIADLNAALIKKDSAALRDLLNDNLNYGHSNGWIQTKEDVIKDLFTDKIVYKKIASTSQSFHIAGNIAWVRDTVDMDVLIDSKPVLFYLNILQVWEWTPKHKQWVLFARQSVAMYKHKGSRR